MDQKKEKFDEFKQKLIQLNKEGVFFEKLRKDENLNRNYQFQIYLLSELQKDDHDLMEMIKVLQEKNFMIHLFNEYLSNEQIYSLLESNDYKINKAIFETEIINPLVELKQQLNELQKIEETRNLKKEYINCFEKSKKSKWFKKVRSKAVKNTIFLALLPNKKKEKFKSLMRETISHLNLEFDLKIDEGIPNEEFIQVFYDYVINWSVKTTLLWTLLTLVILFFVVLATILILVY